MFIGIDLGTTNSAIASFDGESVTITPNSKGDNITPSVVRFTQNKVIVGSKAKKHLLTDPQNTYKEFKRLMGTKVKLQSVGKDSRRSPEALSAEVLKALSNDFSNQKGIQPKQVVITVPALFELPQSNATVEAGRIAGFDKVELIPEPVASALAAGWTAEEDSRPWLVYDLGGGTFDISLLESRDGLLRVVGHEGDNFLGGRDIDRLIVDWIKTLIHNEHDILITEDKPDHQAVLAHLYIEAELAKIRLSTISTTTIELDFDIDGNDIELDIPFSREKLEQLCEPVIERSLVICEDLLRNNGLNTENVGKVVMVGGPANMPVVRKMVETRITQLADGDLDPMTLVAKGAALYAATIGLENKAPTDISPTEKQVDAELWLQYPSVSSDLNPDLMGRLVASKKQKPTTIKLIRNDGLWESEATQIHDNGSFMLNFELLPSRSNCFDILLSDANGESVSSTPSILKVVHGLTLSDPPLSRSIGLALADGSVKRFIERGTPLPAKRTFVQHTTETMIPNTDQKLNIPIIQGERNTARFCRKVGHLVIDSNQLKKPLHAGSEIEVSIEIDRGANLTATALIKSQDKVIEGVADLIMISATPESLKANHQHLQQTLIRLQQEAFREKDEEAIRALDKILVQFQSISTDIARCNNDEDACLRAQRNLLDIDADLENITARGQLEELLESCKNTYMEAQYSVDTWGNEVEKNMLAECATRLQQAFDAKRNTELERLVEQMNKIRHSAYRKSDDFWKDYFEYYVSRIHEAKNIKEANRLADEGRKLIASNNKAGLSSIVKQLDSILPQDRVSREFNHESGIH